MTKGDEMKYVINRCFGGFGISEMALRRLHLDGCPHIKLHDPEEYYGGRDGWREQFEKARASDGIMRVIVIDGKIATDEHRATAEARCCAQLVSIVESMGDAADGWAANLEVVEVPDGVDVEVAEYDGLEHLAETHRRWP